MKTNFMHGALTVLTLFLFFCPLAAQKTNAALAATAHHQVVKGESSFHYSEVAISGPAIYAEEEFTISLLVENKGKKAGTHEVKLYLQEAGTPDSRKGIAVQKVKLRPGDSQTISFALQAEDLVEVGEKAPDSFIFYLGKYEIGVDYIEE